MPLPWPGRVPALEVLRGVWQPGWWGTALPAEVPSPCTPFFTAGAVAMPTPPGQQPQGGQAQAGGRSCHGTSAGRQLPSRACNNSRWPGTTLSAFIVNEEIIKSILQS